MSDVVTRILASIEQGSAMRADELLPLVYAELRKLAASKMARESPNQTLQPTALVHEAWLRLSGKDNANLQAVRHGSGLQRVDFEQVDLPCPEDDHELLQVHEALDKLALQNKREAELVKLRYFVGMTLEEAADVLQISPRTADNYRAHARAWLFRELKAG